MIGCVCLITVMDCKREVTLAVMEASRYAPKLQQDQDYHSVQERVYCLCLYIMLMRAHIVARNRTVLWRDAMRQGGLWGWLYRERDGG